MEIKGGCARDVCRREGRVSAVAGRDLARGGIDEADKCAGNINRNVFRVEEPGVIAAVPDRELMLESCVRVGEGATLWLEDWSNVFVWGDNVEPCKKVVVHQSNDVLCGGEGFPKAGVK